MNTAAPETQPTLVLDFGDGEAGTFKAHRQANNLTLIENIDNVFSDSPFESIKAVYKRMKSPERKLVDVMRMGSGANLGPHWGKARMPDGSERPPISDREAKQLARWILS